MAEGDSCHEGNPSFIRLDTGMPTFAAMQVAAAWNVTRGSGVTVAIVDSGVNGSDPRLEKALLPGINLVEDGTDKNGWTDQYGHGTAIAGQIVASATDSSSLVGLAPSVKILPVRVYAGTDERTAEAGHGLVTSRLVAGIRAAADAGAEIINVAISSESASDDIDRAVAYATAKGSLVVASAGNVKGSLDLSAGGTTQLRYPAASPGALGVTAASVPGNMVTDASVHGAHVDLAAPGQNVLTLGLNTGDCVYATDAPASSYATGYASAVAALVAAAYPDETPEQWTYRLTATALRGNPDQRTDVSGWGVVQPFQALTAVLGPDTRGPESPFFEASESAEPEVPIAVEPPGNQHEVDLDRVVLIGVSAFASLALVGSVVAFRNRGVRR
ncbi:S8 family serine peptidase [Microbacterium sp. YY-03]|uniref:S8 family serine peptidase n=1 Tax=Microbacterium sp. YY-03 TaxID=3421636 RepID=UPI003D179996